MNDEPSRFVTKISDGEQVDLSLLSKEQLRNLHYNEEKFTASALFKMPPFSDERRIRLNKDYYLVETIMKWYIPQKSGSNGASIHSVA